MKKKLIGKKLIAYIGVFIMFFTLCVNTSFAEINRDKSFSLYKPDIYNDYDETYLSSFLQYRMNCYGYASQLYLLGSLPNNEPYKQQPGWFARSGHKEYIVNNIVPYNPSASMDNIINNMAYDAYALGYTLYYYNLAEGENPVTYGNGYRVIALVTGNTDYHYYMQHSDGTWSHKPGSTKVTNLSLTDQVALTNDSIVEKANQGSYAGGELRFFILTKDAVVDHPHGAYDSSTGEIPIYYTDWAGEYTINSETITIGSRTSLFDYYVGDSDSTNDVDTFCFKPTTSGNYRFYVNSNYDTDGYLFDENGETIATDLSLSDVDITYSLTAGKNYFIKIWNYDKTFDIYTINVEQK